MSAGKKGNAVLVRIAGWLRALADRIDPSPVTRAGSIIDEYLTQKGEDAAAVDRAIKAFGNAELVETLKRQNVKRGLTRVK